MERTESNESNPLINLFYPLPVLALHQERLKEMTQKPLKSPTVSSRLLLMVFIKKISSRGHEEEGLWFRNMRVWSLLFALNVFLFTLSLYNHSYLLEQFVSFHLIRRPWSSTTKRWLALSSSLVSLCFKWRSSIVLFMNDCKKRHGSMDWVWSYSGVMLVCLIWFVMVKKETGISSSTLSGQPWLWP